MRRKLFNFAAAVSLVLCLVAMVLWARSYWIGDSLRTVRSTSTDDSFIRRDTVCRTGRGFACIATSVSITTHAQMLKVNMLPHNFNDVTEWTTSRPAQRAAGSSFADPARNPRLTHWDCSLVGWRIHKASASNGFAGWNFFVPLWQVVLLTAILPALWIHRARRNAIRQRRSKNQCIACGYSLTGNTSGVCPECGTAVPKEPANKSPRPA